MTRGQGMEIFEDDLIAKMNKPTRKDRVDTSHLSRLDGTDIVQWYGRKSDGRFHPIGRIMRLTQVGKERLLERRRERGISESHRSEASLRETDR